MWPRFPWQNKVTVKTDSGQFTSPFLCCVQSCLEILTTLVVRINYMASLVFKSLVFVTLSKDVQVTKEARQCGPVASALDSQCGSSPALTTSWFIVSCPELKSSAMLVNSRLVASWQLGFFNPIMFCLDCMFLVIGLLVTHQLWSSTLPEARLFIPQLQVYCII